VPSVTSVEINKHKIFDANNEREESVVNQHN